MKLDNDAQVYLWWDADLTVNPTGSTVEFELDGVRKPMAWQGSPVQVGTRWTQTARSTDKLAGSTVTPGAGLIVLTSGQHIVKPIATLLDSQVVPGRRDRVDAD